MNREVYLLGGHLRNHVWKFVCIVNDNGDLKEESYFKFVDESNDIYYGLWGKGYSRKDRCIRTGGNQLKVEGNIRCDKNNIEWNEPATRHRWNSETGKAAILKRWENTSRESYTFKTINIYGESVDNEKCWRVDLKVRSDGNKIYTYFEF